MCLLPSSLVSHVASFVQDPKECLALLEVDKEARREPNSWKGVQNHYERTFGSLPSEFKVGAAHLGALRKLFACAGKQLNPKKNYNLYDPPKTRLEKLKWRLGFDNVVDQRVEAEFNTMYSLLEKSSPKSILQLRNHYYAFDHVNAFRNDYLASKKEVRSTSFISRMFFSVLKWFFGFVYRSSSEVFQSRYRDKVVVAQIGKFSLPTGDYSVTAQKGLYGHVLVKIHKEGSNVFCGAFTVLMGWDLQDGSPYSEDWAERKVLPPHAKKYVKYENLRFCDTTRDPNGSDRLIDQKITQLMVEIFQHNSSVETLRASCGHDLYIVLTAGGLSSYTDDRDERRMNELMEFRSHADNHLFPPYKDYGGVSMHFHRDSYDQPNVFFQREGSLSWKEMIEKNPILLPDAGVLPDYWDKKPLFSTT